jgi:probable F420-dependent oxidoreductase
MRFGYILPNYGGRIAPDDLVAIGLACEEEGYDSVWATDHIIMPTELREPYGEVLEPLVTLASIAARTKRIRVGTSILVLPQRNPILVAKQAATLDAFSGGRVILGLGAGWAEREFGYLNAGFGQRSKVYEESVVLMRELWREDVVNFQGRYFKVEDALFLPKPVHGTIPLWFGGNSDISVRRAARLGDGWHPVGIDVDEFSKGADLLRKLGKKVILSIRMSTDIRKKRDNSLSPNRERRVAVSGTSAEVRKAIDGYASVGLEYYCASMNHSSSEEILRDVRKFAADVVRSYA